jgi:hypothetical protein
MTWVRSIARTTDIPVVQGGEGCALNFGPSHVLYVDETMDQLQVAVRVNP